MFLDNEGIPNTGDNTIDPRKGITASPSQILKRGQAGEGAAGDAGDVIGREISAMERIRVCEREGEIYNI